MTVEALFLEAVEASGTVAVDELVSSGSFFFETLSTELVFLIGGETSEEAGGLEEAEDEEDEAKVCGFSSGKSTSIVDGCDEAADTFGSVTGGAAFLTFGALGVEEEADFLGTETFLATMGSSGVLSLSTARFLMLVSIFSSSNLEPLSEDEALGSGALRFFDFSPSPLVSTSWDILT